MVSPNASSATCMRALYPKYAPSVLRNPSHATLLSALEALCIQLCACSELDRLERQRDDEQDREGAFSSGDDDDHEAPFRAAAVLLGHARQVEFLLDAPRELPSALRTRLELKPYHLVALRLHIADLARTPPGTARERAVAVAYNSARIVVRCAENRLLAREYEYDREPQQMTRIVTAEAHVFSICAHVTNSRNDVKRIIKVLACKRLGWPLGVQLLERIQADRTRMVIEDM